MFVLSSVKIVRLSNLCIFLFIYAYESMDTVHHYLIPMPNISMVLKSTIRTTGSCPISITGRHECLTKARLIYGNMVTSIRHDDWDNSDNVPPGCSIVTAIGFFWRDGHVMSNINTHINPQNHCTEHRTCICG